MSYGDAFASIIGEKFGKPRSRFWGKKTYEGSLGMFLATLLFVAVCLLYMSVVFVFPVTSILPVGLAVAFVATIAEALTPRGLDNITVPALTVLVSIILLGGI
ncbi:MAG: hypothetical protein GX638_11395 [Crenarchaeota archaeon]|nr:hypothetical protein [Thermoproteota archaeon]